MYESSSSKPVDPDNFIKPIDPQRDQLSTEEAAAMLGVYHILKNVSYPSEADVSHIKSGPIHKAPKATQHTAQKVNEIRSDFFPKGPTFS
jgi:hypothetical protein